MATLPTLAMHRTLSQQKDSPVCDQRLTTIKENQSSHNGPTNEQRKGEVGGQCRPVPHGASTHCACLSNDGSKAFLLWNMIHSFHSFLATGCQSASCNSRIHLLCYEGAGSTAGEGRGMRSGEEDVQEDFPAWGRTDSVVWGWGNQACRRRNIRVCLPADSLKQGLVLLSQLLASCFCINY